MPLPREQIYTSEDYWNLPDEQRAELIDGQLYAMVPPNYLHQKISFALARKIADHIDANKGACEVIPAPFAVNLNTDDKTWVEPDLSIICDRSKLTDRGCEGAPDWVIEIVSPTSQRMDYGVKLFKYRTAKVREYWIVNPMTKTVQTYSFEGEEDSHQYTFEDTVPVHIFDNLMIKIADLL